MEEALNFNCYYYFFHYVAYSIRHFTNIITKHLNKKKNQQQQKKHLNNLSE